MTSPVIATFMVPVHVDVDVTDEILAATLPAGYTMLGAHKCSGEVYIGEPGNRIWFSDMDMEGWRVTAVKWEGDE